jgi:hypothetical protein
MKEELEQVALRGKYVRTRDESRTVENGISSRLQKHCRSSLLKSSDIPQPSRKRRRKCRTKIIPNRSFGTI